MPPPPRSLAHRRREIAERKWVETRQCAEGRARGKKYRLPNRRVSDGRVAGSGKGLAAWYYS